MSRVKRLAYRVLAWLDGYWHVYVCTLVERYAEEAYAPEKPTRREGTS